MKNIKNAFFVISVMFFISLPCLGGDASREQRTARKQEIRISEIRRRRLIVECIKDHKRLDSTAECDEWPLQAWLDEENEAIVLNDQERQRLIAFLKEYREQRHYYRANDERIAIMEDYRQEQLFWEKTRRIPDTGIDILLIQLADQETIDMLVDKFADRNYEQISPASSPSGLLRTSKQPAVIPALSAILFTEEEIHRYRIGNMIYDANSVRAMYIIIYILRESDQFSDEVREWARSLLTRDFSDNQRRELVRVWWKVNQEAMLDGAYMNTRPLTENEHSLINKDDQAAP